MGPVDSSCWTAFRFITGHPFRLMLQDSRLDDPGQVCTLSRWDMIGISAVPIRLITRRHSLFARSSTPWGVQLHSLALDSLTVRIGQTPWGLPCSVDNPSLKCLGAPSPAVARGTANQQNGSADSGYLPFGPSVSEWFRLSCVTRFIGVHCCSPCTSQPSSGQNSLYLARLHCPVSYRKTALPPSHVTVGSRPQSWAGGFAPHDYRRLQVAARKCNKFSINKKARNLRDWSCSDDNGGVQIIRTNNPRD